MTPHYITGGTEMKVNWKQRLGFQKGSTAVNLTEGPIIKSILLFAIPLFMGQLLQQCYNLADAWVIGNFADNDSFAAVSSAGNLTFLIIGLFSGIATGGGVIISKYYGALYPGVDENTGKRDAKFAGLFSDLFWRRIHHYHV